MIATWSISWNASSVVARIGAEPPIAIIGVASAHALASPVSALAVPGPDGVMQMPGLPGQGDKRSQKRAFQFQLDLLDPLQTVIGRLPHAPNPSLRLPLPPRPATTWR